MSPASTASRSVRASSLPESGRTLTRRATYVVRAHPVWAIFAVALAVRVVAAVAIAVLQPHNLSADAIGYSRLSAGAAAGQTAHWSSYWHWLYDRTATLLMPITGLYELFGAHQLLGQLYVALLGAGTAAIVTRIALELMPRRWAIGAGLIVAFLPTQVIWSSLILKDPAVWILLSALALTIALAGRADGLRLLGLGLVAGALLVLLGHLRLQTLVIAAWAMMLAAVLSPRRGRLQRTAGALALGVMVPWLVFNLEPAGLRVLHLQPPPSVLRSKNAEGARSAITGAQLPLSSNGTRIAIGAHENELSVDLTYLPQGILLMLVKPYPWGRGSVYAHLAGAEQLIWYPLLLLGFVGLVGLRRRHLRVMAFPVIAGGTILILYALTEGNVGTAFRHRGEFEWVVAILATLGLAQIAAWRSRRRADGRASASVSGHPSTRARA